MASAGSDNENPSPYRKGILRHCLPHRSVDGPNAEHRADQTTKVKGMFVRPEQIAEIGKRHPELGRLRLIVTREGETDVMTLKAEIAVPSDQLREAVAATLRAVTQLQ